MVESSNVLGLMKAVYTIYVMLILSLIGICAIGITSKKQIPLKVRIPIYGWIGFLIFVGVGIHILTFNRIPWVKWDLNRDSIRADQEFNIAIADYKFQLPDKRLFIGEGQTVRFNLESKDYTYGFGLFREDGTMVFQMQVVPGSRNDLIWRFDRSGTYSIRSTEYSGPKGGNLLVKNAVVIAKDPVMARLTSQDEPQQN
ncbi:MAG: hypothetical protein OHK0032_12150 [Thermodesulfovibrionales bacterium]